MPLHDCKSIDKLIPFVVSYLYEGRYRQTVSPEWFLCEVTALFGWRGGYFSFLVAVMNRPMMPTIKMPISIRSEYVTMSSTPFPMSGGKEAAPDEGANRLPYSVAPPTPYHSL